MSEIVEMIYGNGAKYIGSVENGLPSGLGTIEFPNGEAYLGNWESGMMNDERSLYRFSDGRCYEGRIDNGVLSYDSESMVTFRGKEILWSGRGDEFRRSSDLRAAIYLDHSNIEANFSKVRVDGQHIDYNRLCARLADGMKLVKKSVFGSESHIEAGKFDWFRKNSFDAQIRTRFKAEKGVDVSMSSTVAIDAALDQFDVAIIVSVDADFIPALEKVRAMGKKIIVASFSKALSSLYYDLCPDEVMYLDNMPIFTIGDLEYRIKEVLPRVNYKRKEATLWRNRGKQYLTRPARGELALAL